MSAVLRIMRFWLDMGVDGFRLDAIPYLVEREGTNNENLRETHAVIKQLRAAIDAITRTASCSPRRINGRRTCANISATATNATWRITSR
jgi:glycosidase